jgi:hypothetical protein
LYHFCHAMKIVQFWTIFSTKAVLNVLSTNFQLHSGFDLFHLEYRSTFYLKSLSQDVFWLCCIKNHLFNVIIDSSFCGNCSSIFFWMNLQSLGCIDGNFILQQSRLYPKRYFDSIADSILVNQLSGVKFFRYIS